MHSTEKEDREFNVIMDRAFDVVCARRAGMEDLAEEIIGRLKEAHPDNLFRIDQAISIYSGVGENLTKPRGDWMAEHRGKMKLKYK